VDKVMNGFEEYAEVVLSELRNSLRAIDGTSAYELAKTIMNANSVFAIGVGRVFLSLQAFVKRLNHLGIAAHCVGSINEPALRSGDLLVVGSGSGESIIPVTIARKAKQLGAKIVHIGSNPHGSMHEFADIMVCIPVTTKLNLPGEIESRQIMTNLFDQSLWLFGDIICQMIADERCVDLNALWQFHANLE